MKLIKSVVLTALALATFTLQAQETHTPKTAEEKAASFSERMTGKLSLTEEQADQVEAAHLEMLKKRSEIKANMSIDAEDRKNQMDALKATHDASMQSILTAEQYETYSTYAAQKEDKRSAEKIAARKTEKMTASLELNEQQQAQVSALNLIVAQKIKAIKDDETMAPEKKREFIKGNKEDYRRALTRILTEEQLKKFDEELEKRKTQSRRADNDPEELEVEDEE